MGFAIPSQIVRPTVETLIRDGKVTHGYIGVGISDITPENSKFFEVKDNRGAVVTQVEADSPGAKAGLKVGDVISEIDGQKVSDAGELQVIVGQKRPGTTLKLAVLRDGKDVTVPVTLEEMGKRDVAEIGSGSQHGKARWGLGLADVTPDTRQQLQAPSDVQGAVIERVLPGSPADIAPRLAGMENADSIALDFHKWAQVPYDAGFLIVRDGELHRDTFSAPAAYLRRETKGLAAGSPWPCDLGPDLSRGFRALKTWFTLKTYGTEKLGAVIARTCAVAAAAISSEPPPAPGVHGSRSGSPS